MNKKRPKQLTIIAILFLIVGLFSLFGSWVLFQGSQKQIPEFSSEAAQETLASSIILILSSVGILKGFRWARALFILDLLAIMILHTFWLFRNTPNFIINLFSVIISLIVIIYILTNKEIQNYFVKQ